MVASANIQEGIDGDRLPRFLDLAVAREHQPRHHQCLRAGARLDKAAIDQQLIDPLFCWC
jgi:hypothetical protein